MTIYSHSRLAAYQNCPLQYKFRYLEKPDIVKSQSIEAFLGTCFHETMEKLYGDLKFDRINSEEELLACFETFWDRGFNDEILIVNKERTASDYKNLGAKCIRSYYKSHYPFDQSRTLGIEERIEVDLDGTGRYRIVGYLDRLSQDDEGVYEIHDYKTSGSLPSQNKLDNDRQLALYHIGLMQNWNDVGKVKLIWHYVVFDKTMESLRTMDELEKLKTSTIALIDEIEAATEFLPQESMLCNWCDYISVCPVKKHQVTTEKLEGNEFLKEEGVSLVNILEKLDDEKKAFKKQINEIEQKEVKAKEALMSYAEKENVDVIVGSNKQAKIVSRLKIQIPKKGSDKWNLLEDRIKDMSGTEAYFSLDGNAVKKAIKENVFTEKELLLLAEFYESVEEKQTSLSKIKNKN